MSHFSKIATRLTEKRLLLRALDELGIAYEEGDIQVYGYQGASTPCEIKIPTEMEGYDIGFRKSGENYEMVADWDSLSELDPESFLNTLTQRYAYCAVKDQLSADFAFVEEKQESDNSIRLLLRRMA